MLCLPFKTRGVFTTAIKDGSINPDQLAKMTSEQRSATLGKFVGADNAAQVNALFEARLLMKNQNQAMISWVKDVAGLKPARQNELIDKINKLGKVLTPTEQDAFLHDLASSKLGAQVNVEEANTIAKLANEFNIAKSKITPEIPNGSPLRLRVGATEVALNNYVNGLRLTGEKQTIKEIGAGFKTNPTGAALEQVSNIAGFAKGVKASLDNSAIFRQGWKTLFTNPEIWAKNAAQSFKDIYKQLGNKATDSTVLDSIKAEIYSRQNAMDNTYKKMHLDIGNLEEAYPTSLPEKIPVFGRLYKASETAYTGFLYRMRADIADKVISIAKDGGVDIADKAQLDSIGKLVNSLTGRGHLGALEKNAQYVNTIFFSPKMVKSSFDFLTAHQLQAGVTPFVRKQAAMNLTKVMLGMSAIIGIAKALDPKSVELDPRSSDFGKIKVGNTRFDVSGGMSSLFTLASRIVTQSSKSSTSHKVTNLGSGYGQKSGMDVAFQFTENKLSPLGAVIKDLINQRDFSGKPLTIGGEVANFVVPLPITNLYEVANDPNGANPILTAIADGLGISTNTYGPKK